MHDFSAAAREQGTPERENPSLDIAHLRNCPGRSVTELFVPQKSRMLIEWILRNAGIEGRNPAELQLAPLEESDSFGVSFVEW